MRFQPATLSMAGRDSSPLPTPSSRSSRRGSTAGRLLLFLVAPALSCGGEVPSGATSTATAPAELDGCVPSEDTQCPGVEAGPTEVPVTPAPVPSADPRTSFPIVDCVGTLAEYCASFGGRCPTYQESLAWHKALCARQPILSVAMRACGHAYRSVGWQGPLVGGREEYFDGAGRLMGAYLFSDHGSFCDGTSFSQTFGTIPTCATGLLEVRLCRAPR